MLNRYGNILDTNWVLPVAVDRCEVVFDYWFVETDGEDARRFIQASLEASDDVQQEDVAMFEIIFTRGTPNAPEMLKAYEQVLAQYGGRPHPGQVNFTTPESARRMYGAKLDEWNGVRRSLDPQGVLRSRWTDAALGTGNPR